MTREQLDQLRDQYLSATFDEIENRLTLDWDETSLDVHRGDLTEEAEALTGGLANVDYRIGMPWAASMLATADEDIRRRLARRLMEAKLEAIKAELNALNGEPLREPFVDPKVRAGTSRSTLKKTSKLSEIAGIYGAQRVAEGNWRPKTELQNRTIYGVLADLMGDPAIEDVTKEMIRAIGNDVVKLPSNMTKRFPGLSPRKVLEKLEADTTTPRLEPRSVNKYRQLLRSLFKWAAENDYIFNNPATVLRDVKEGKVREDRKPFTDEDLRAYFSELPASSSLRPFLFWIPRILAFTGMRLGECAQLRKEDFRKAQGLTVFDINDEDGKTLKNQASRRQVPIHIRLVDLGLLEFVDAMPPGFLWPANMRSTANPQRGDMDRLSKLLARLLRSAGVNDPKKTGAHSFRHTVATRLKAESVPDYQISDLIGHEDDSETTGRYGKATNMARLAEVLKLLRLPI